MFLVAAMGLRYLEMSDLIANGLYISAAALVARVATVIIIKKMAAEKNRSEASWMTLAMIAPSLSLILMSFFGTIAKKERNIPVNNEKKSTATIKNYESALEIQMNRPSKAM
jgi:Na+/melibiose symporter-like transporter